MKTRDTTKSFAGLIRRRRYSKSFQDSPRDLLTDFSRGQPLHGGGQGDIF